MALGFGRVFRSYSHESFRESSNFPIVTTAMSTKKKKNPAADDLIQSLMDDLNPGKTESSSKDEDSVGLYTANSSEVPAGMRAVIEQNYRVEQTNAAIANMWDHLEKNFGDEVPSVEEKPFLEGDIFAEDYEIPSIGEEGYQGPSAEGGYQNTDDIFSQQSPPSRSLSSDRGSNDEATKPVFNSEDKTVSIQESEPANAYKAGGSEATDADRTLAVQGFANAKLGARRTAEIDAKVSIGQLRSAGGSSRPGSVFTSMDASLVQSENLKLAQQRILDLEKEVEKFRAENEELASAGEIIHSRVDEYAIRISALQKDKKEIEESHHSEVMILKGSLQYKETEVGKARVKVEELETRLKADFKKIRVKERELENRLELVRAEKSALVRSKDEYILDMKRKIDQLQSELDNYRGKVLELNKTLESNQDQFKRTVRALRLALSNLEVKEENLVPLKKAE